MAALKINDLPLNRALDRQAMTTLRGGFGGGHPMFGWMLPSASKSPSLVPAANNFLQNNTYIGQVVNQTQNVSLINTGRDSSLTAVLIGGQSSSGG